MAARLLQPPLLAFGLSYWPGCAQAGILQESTGTCRSSIEHGNRGLCLPAANRRQMHADNRGTLGTTFLCVRKVDKVIIIGGGQVTLGAEITKPNVRKVRRLGAKIICEFAGSAQAGGQTPQNVDLPPVQPKRKKKPFVTPIKHGSHQKRLRAKASRLLPPKPLIVPANGMLVEGLIPVAYTVLEARSVLLDGVTRLLRHLPVKACRLCPEVHVGREGHDIRTCQGKNSTTRCARHDWMPGYVDDVIFPLDAYHLVDRMARPMKHEERFDVDRIPAIVELCIQAGVDLPEHPTLRRTSPIQPQQRRGVVQEAELDTEMELEMASGDEKEDSGHSRRETDGTDEQAENDSLHASDNTIQSNDPDELRLQARTKVGTIDEDDDLKTVAEKTIHAWETMSFGASQLMKVYRVSACGYCPEVHIGPRGHKDKLCGAFKHQWRNGQHGWQEAALNDLIPPRYVWHVRDLEGPPLTNKYKAFYGQAPAVIELCIQAGAEIPEKYKPLLRLDVIIPDVGEYDMVA